MANDYVRAAKGCGTLFVTVVLGGMVLALVLAFGKLVIDYWQVAVALLVIGGGIVAYFWWQRRNAPPEVVAAAEMEDGPGPTAPDAPSEPTTVASPPDAPDAVLGDLERLQRLHRDGVLTDAQFETQRDRIIRQG